MRSACASPAVARPPPMGDVAIDKNSKRTTPHEMTRILAKLRTDLLKCQLIIGNVSITLQLFW